MIAINKHENTIPVILKNRVCENREVIDSKIYGDKTVKEILLNLYNNKCAYCEKKSSNLDIEHYRPKKQVTGIPRKEHNGYYWLAYEWTNLLPACRDCNRQGAKGTHFPIEGIRVFHPKFLLNKNIDLDANNFASEYLQRERPLLLNPETQEFDPFIYFAFDETGLMTEVPDKGSFEYRQASETIKTVNLNRDDLYLNYRKSCIVKLFEDEILKLLAMFLNEELNPAAFKKLLFYILDKIKDASSKEKECSFFWSYLYSSFTFFIRFYFQEDLSALLIKLYLEHKGSNN